MLLTKIDIINKYLKNRSGIDAEKNSKKNSVVNPYEKEMTGRSPHQIAKDIVNWVIDYQSTPEAKTKKCMFLYTYFEANGIQDLSDEDKDNLKELKDLAKELSNNGPCVLESEPSLFLNIAILLRDIEFYKNLRKSGSLLTSDMDTPPFENLLNCENKEFILNVVNYECAQEKLPKDFAQVMPAFKCIDRNNPEEIKLALDFTTAIYFKNEVNFWNTYKSTETAKDVWLKIKDSVKDQMFQNETMLWAYMCTIDSKLFDIDIFKYSENQESEFTSLHQLFHNPDFIKEIIGSFSAPGGLVALSAIIKKINQLGFYSIQKDNKLEISLSTILAIKDNDGWSAWHWMVNNNQMPEFIKLLMELGFDKSELLTLLKDGLVIKNNDGWSAWHWIAFNNQMPEFIKLLAELDFDKSELLTLLKDGLAIKDNNGNSVWHEIAFNKQIPAVIKALAELGLDKSELITLLTNGLAIKHHNNGECVWYWIASYNQMPEFIKALASKDLGFDKSALLTLLTNGLAIKNDNGECAWYWMAKNNQMLELIKALASKDLGFDKSELLKLIAGGLAIQHNDDWSNWHFIASYNQMPEFIKALADLGFDKAEVLTLLTDGLAIKDNNGNSVWHEIAYSDQMPELIKALAELGVSKEELLTLLTDGLAIKDNNGNSAWYWIAYRDQIPEFIKALAELGVSKEDWNDLL